jgi:hypothetical protein
MNCQDIKEKFVDFLTDELSPREKQTARDHLSSCQTCREEMEELTSVWARLGVLEEEAPSPMLRTRFYDMLESYRHGLEEGRESLGQRFSRLFRSVWPQRPALQAALSVGLLLVGVLVGSSISTKQAPSENMNALRQEVSGLRQTLAVSLMDQTSATERLKGVNLTAATTSPNMEMIDRLLQTTSSDPNINVRLAAVDALYLFRDQPRVREGLVETLSRQDSPLVQVALIDLFVSMKEKRAVDALKLLIEDQRLFPEVREKAQEGLQQLSF